MTCWLVDELLTERAYETGYPSIAEVAAEQGHQVYKTRYVPFSKLPDTDVPFEEGGLRYYPRNGAVLPTNREVLRASLDPWYVL